AGPAAGHAGRDAPAAPEPLAAGPGDPDPADAGLAASIPATDLTSSYDHLWERTVMRNIEDAAVREEPGEGGDASAPAPLLKQAPVVAVPASAEEPAPALDSPLQNPAHERPAPESSGPESPVQETPDASAAPELPVPPPAGVLIDSVPWRTGGDNSPKAPAPAPLASGTPGTPVGSPPSNVPASMPLPSPAGAAQVPGPAQGQGPFQVQGPAGFDGDHDGQTVMKSSLAANANAPATATAGASAGGSTAATGGPQVLARVCAQGHPNPPTRTTCAACGGALLQDAVQVARPRLGRMRLSTGELLDLDQSLVIGRQPSVSRVQGGVMPRLVQVASPGGDISRSHVEVRLEGWHVMLCDLKATNGTVLVREGQPPRRLAQNEMAILLDGDIAELGDNISLRFEEIP
ncbi:FHA domain-containing protein, partial [Arthrobacter sp. AD-310]